MVPDNSDNRNTVLSIPERESMSYETDPTEWDEERMQEQERTDWYEFQLGIYVAADSEDEAWKKLQPLLDLANKIDPEGDATVEYVAKVDNMRST